MNDLRIGLYDPARESSACGVGFITRKDGRQDHDVIVRGEHALCAIPHRGGMSSEGVGDGAGVSVDLSVRFFSALTGWPLEPGAFGVANLFMPTDPAYEAQAREIVRAALERQGLEVLLERLVPVDPSALRPAAVAYQLPIVQWVFVAPADRTRSDVDRAANAALLEIEQSGYERPELAGLYPLSLSARTQVLKGRLNAGEVVRYFTDLVDPRHEVRTLYFHTRFSTNTEPHPTMAQPFRMMAHNGELNTDRKNRLADDAGARARLRRIVRPPGQSDSSRLDQTLQSRVFDDGLDIVEAVVSLMPPAWENDQSLPAPIRDMLEFFSLYEEKNDGPAARHLQRRRRGRRPAGPARPAPAAHGGDRRLPDRRLRGRPGAAARRHGGAPRPDRGRRHALPRPPHRPDPAHPGGAGGAGGPARLRRAAGAGAGRAGRRCRPRRSPAAPARWATTAT